MRLVIWQLGSSVRRRPAGVVDGEAERERLIGCQFNDWKAFNRAQLIDRHEPGSKLSAVYAYSVEVGKALLAPAPSAHGHYNSMGDQQYHHHHRWVDV